MTQIAKAAVFGKSLATTPDTTAQLSPTDQRNYTPNLGYKTPILFQKNVMRLKASPMTVLTGSALGTARTHTHNTVGRKPGDDLGFGNAAADIQSTIAELMVYGSLLHAGRKPERYEAFCVRPTKDPDFWINGKSYDVKSVAADKFYCTLNAHKHHNHPPDAYIVVVFDSDTTATVSLVSSGDVTRFWKRRSGHSDYYSIHRDQLPRLSSWDAMEGGCL